MAPAPTPLGGIAPANAPISVPSVNQGEETTPPGSVPGAPQSQPTLGAIPGLAPAPAGGALDKVEMILAVVAFLITIGCVVVLAIMKV